MSPREVVSRIGFQVKKNFWRHPAQSLKLFRDCTPIYSFEQHPFNPFTVDPTSPQGKLLITEAENILRHSWDFFDLDGVVEPIINWQFDPTSGLSAPFKFSFDINHRDTSTIGNAKVIWEKSRHHHLTVLCAAYTVTKQEKYAFEATMQLLDWIGANPCLMGINWTHPLELGIRLISWVWCERLLRGSTHYKKAFGAQSPVWLSIGQHQEIIARTFSKGSSANNHLIGEAAGLFITSSAFPIYKKSEYWLKLSHRILEREIVKQTFPSGVNREMAFEYQLFVAEFLLLCLYESRNTDIKFSEIFVSLLKKSIEAISHLSDFGRNMPHYGDGDDGMALKLQSRKESRATWILQLGSILTNALYPYSDEISLSLRFMGYDRDFNKSIPIKLPESPAFKDAGIFILTNKRNTPKEIFVTADAGPLGYLTLAAHGHADALSFTLSAGGKPIFVDPGTYSYFTHSAMRNYFRSTKCHNTVFVDNCDQSKLQGTFLWSHKAKSFLTEWKTDENGAIFCAYHDGYKKNLGCIHSRKVLLLNNVLTIHDVLSGAESHTVCLCFHCAPQCSLKQEPNNRISIVNGSVSVVLSLPKELTITIHKGEREAGWYSPSFGVKVPAYTIFAQTYRKFPMDLTTTIEVLHEC